MEYFLADYLTHTGLDVLLADGWRHFGPLFFRYRTQQEGNRLHTVIPLRINLNQFRLSDSQRKILRRNRELDIRIVPTAITPELVELFHLHRQRFQTNAPESLEQFFSPMPSLIPCKNESILVYDESMLVGAGFLDSGAEVSSSVYGLFNPAYSSKNPGILTMLLEIQLSIERGFKYYYPGYCYADPSYYDYKKQFFGLEAFSWRMEAWTEVPRFFERQDLPDGFHLPSDQTGSTEGVQQNPES